MNILEKVCEYDCTSMAEAKRLLQKAVEYLLKNKLSFSDKAIINNIRKLMTSVIFSDDFEEPDKYLIDETKGRILEFKKA